MLAGLAGHFGDNEAQAFLEASLHALADVLSRGVVEARLEVGLDAFDALPGVFDLVEFSGVG